MIGLPLALATLVAATVFWLKVVSFSSLLLGLDSLARRLWLGTPLAIFAHALVNVQLGLSNFSAFILAHTLV